MLKFGGSRPEADGAEAKDRERKQRHQRTAAAVAAAATSATPGNGASAMDISRGDSTPKLGVGGQQMAPPDIPFGTGQPPVV